MPLPPPIEKADPNDPYSSLADVYYNTPTSIMGNFHDMLQGNLFKTMTDKAEADPNIPMLQYLNISDQTQDFINEVISRPPATQEEIDTIQGDRPGLVIPKGSTKVVANMMASNWDNKQYFDFVAARPASMIAKFGGYVGAAAGGLLDPFAVIGGGLASKGAERVIEPYAKSLMKTLATNELMGSGVAQVATKIAQASLKTGAGFGGFQGVEELGEQGRRVGFNEPSSWLQSLQNVGNAIGLGGKLGAAGEVLSLGLFGYDRPMVSKTTNEVEAVERVGGLFNSDAFSTMTDKAKSVVAKWLPWSIEADQNAREEAIGQGLNGNEPNPSLMLRQGAIDEGARYRQILDENNIDKTDLDRRLVQADGEANTKLEELARTRDALKESDKKLLADKNISINDNKDLSQKGLLDRYQKSQFNPQFMENEPETIPDNFQKHIEIQDQINKLQAKVDDVPNKQTSKRIAQLKKRLPKILTPKEELEGIKKRLLDKGLADNFEDTNDYKRLSDLANVWSHAKNLLDRINLEKDHQLQLKDLASQKVVIDSMRNHINGTHEPITPEEGKAYADRSNSIDVGNINYDLPDSVDTTYDEQLENFGEDEIQRLLDVLPEAKAEIENTIEKRKTLPLFKKFVKATADCILRNEV